MAIAKLFMRLIFPILLGMTFFVVSFLACLIILALICYCSDSSIQSKKQRHFFQKAFMISFVIFAASSFYIRRSAKDTFKALRIIAKEKRVREIILILGEELTVAAEKHNIISVGKIDQVVKEIIEP